MKIAILTLPLHTNYGGILQAYALQTVLQRLGHDVEVLQTPSTSRHNPALMPLVYGKRLAKKFLKDWNSPVFLERKKKREYPIIRQHTDRFIARYLNLREIRSLTDVSPSDYDAFIVGSDQIWRKPYFNDMWHAPMKDAFLDFTKGWDVKRIAYAASFGMDNINEYSESDIKDCKEALRMFDAISVREDSGVEICKSNFGIDATHALDPTMLLTKEDYEKIVKESNMPESYGDMLCYILDPTALKTEVINKVSAEKGFKPFNVFAEVDNVKLPLEQRVQPPLESWLRGFMDAEFVVTDSFHACVFSIIFGKPFLAIGNAGRGMGRFTSLLSTFGLQSRLILSEEDFKNKNLKELEGINPITFDKIREHCLNYLESNI